MSKYIKLSADRTEKKSAIFSSKPKQIRRFDDSEINQHDWFIVEEHRVPFFDRELYDEVQSGWELKDGVVHINYTTQLIDLDERRQIVADRCTQYRNQLMRRGIVFNGYHIDTREETYKRVTGAVLSTVLDPEYTTHWVTEDNQTILLGSDEIKALGNAFAEFERSHILTCREIKDQILVSEFPEDFDYRDMTLWPTNEFNTPQV